MATVKLSELSRQQEPRDHLDRPDIDDSFPDIEQDVVEPATPEPKSHRQEKREEELANGADDPGVEKNDVQPDVDSLQQSIKALQDKLRELEEKKQTDSPRQYHVLYRIHQDIYFDHPEWTEGKTAIVSRAPVENLDLFLERHKSVLFIILHDFHRVPSLGEVGNPHQPRHTEESILPVDKDLLQAFRTVLQSDRRFESFLRFFRLTGELRAPHMFFYHNRSGWTRIIKDFPRRVREHLAMVERYMSETQKDVYNSADEMFAQGRVSVNFVKYLFQPGDILVSRNGRQYRGVMPTSWPRLTENALHERAQPSGSSDLAMVTYTIQVWYWVFDGSFRRQYDEVSLSLSQKTPHVALEDTEWEIHEMSVYPLSFASNSIAKGLRRRGETFWGCRKRCLISYRESSIEGVDKTSGERFMIDYETFRRLQPEDNSQATEHFVETMNQDDMDRDDPPDKLTLYLLPLQTKGFSFRSKKWLDLDVDQIHPIAWNKKAFETLVLERRTKELILALVNKQISTKNPTDVIVGKGNGLNILLHGSPGTGKTLTAECVAEIAEKPLYRVSGADAGTKAKEVEEFFESVLHLGKIWDCIVLLDEAEVFLERRSLDDLQRNALVTVFSRVIQYHEGILILTSTRVGTFDEAFRSRLQLAVYYPPLRSFQRQRIWKNFFDRLESFEDRKVDVDELRDHLEDLQDMELNGAQIRNAITTARQYADWKGQIMNYEHLTTALEVAERFERYSQQLSRGMTDEQITRGGG